MMLTQEELLRARILIVDDQESNVRVIERLLAEADYTNVATTMNPREVCALQRRHDYDLIVLDLQMPGLDGFEVMKQLQVELTGGYLPIIALTADPGYKLRALQSGAKDFISKPFDLIEVKTRIGNLLEVRLLYKRLERHQKQLEQTVLERTAELRASEARYRNLTELATDWYWEQDENGSFTKAVGPIIDMLGSEVGTNGGEPLGGDGWNDAAREALRDNVAARRPFVNLALNRITKSGIQERFLVSGEPIFNEHCRFVGYRGVGIEVNNAH
jgi:CheY-like chemotaxis protein